VVRRAPRRGNFPCRPDFSSESTMRFFDYIVNRLNEKFLHRTLWKKITEA
jgi:sarcosine oxidase delta subunit